MAADRPDPGKNDLQFERAEAAGEKPAGPVCALCQKPITTYYYEAGGQVVCASCKNKVQASNVRGVAASGFLRATLFGVGGAAAGAAVYYAVLATTGYEIGLIAILVGFMVGYAVRLGARGQGGRRYQIMAVTLTYLAIGSTYVPLVMREFAARDQAAADSTRVAGASGAAGATADAATTPDRAGTDTAGVARGPVAALLGVSALVALAAAMPILLGIAGFPSSLISVLIVAFALHQAWRMNGRVKVTFSGPFKVGAPTPSGGAPGA
jgi:hypothetical protein